MKGPIFRSASRREIMRQGLCLGLWGTAGTWFGCKKSSVGVGNLPINGERTADGGVSTQETVGESGESYEYIVIGSGAGGGPVACNLARAGKRVLLLEAGGSDDEKGSSDYNYYVPALHAFASEDPRVSWNFFVKHYDQDPGDSKFVPGKGILYPRASTLGGCTTHNAMITMYPHSRDWNDIASLTRDQSWEASHMRRYFQQLERCQYMRESSGNKTLNGFRGWLGTSQVEADLIFKDSDLLRLLTAVTIENGLVDVSQDFFNEKLDPNRWDDGRPNIDREGVYNVPLAMRATRRNGVREYILATKTNPKYANNLTIVTNALASRILLDDQRTARGVEYLVGDSLYRADAQNKGGSGTPKMARATIEVIVAAGAFNTPQLLKLSGIGPAAELRAQGINVRIDLPGVGENLQDRYEVGVISQMKSDFNLTKKCLFNPPVDPCYDDYLLGKGPYKSNGVFIGVARKSRKDLEEPDLYIFGLPAHFRGYFPGYSKDIATYKDHFTWAILKAHTRNTAGRVKLQTTDPRDMPDINFRYFKAGNDGAGEDLRAAVEGIKYARKLMQTANVGGILPIVEEELIPGKDVKSDEDLAGFVEKEAWGHHASCSCRMGPAGDSMAVVDSRFRVHGAKGLRIVDASVFPKIPGMFIVVPIYMISHKASQVILEDAGFTGFDALDFSVV